MKSRRAPGFSLIEMVMALFLLAISIVILASTFPFVSRSGKQSDKLTVATFLGQQIMEQVLIQDSKTWPTSGTFAGAYEQFAYQLDSEPWPQSPQLQLLRVRVIEAPPAAGKELFVIETLVIK